MGFGGFPGGLDGKISACSAGDPIPGSLIPWSRRSSGEGNGNSLQYSCLDSSMDGGAWWATIHRVAKNRTLLKRLSCCSVTQSCLTLCDSMDSSLPGSSVNGTVQARILEWVDIPFFRGSSRSRDQIWASCISGRFFTV